MMMMTCCLLLDYWIITIGDIVIMVIGSRAFLGGPYFRTGHFLVCVSVRLFRDYLHCLCTDLDETSFRIEYRYVVVSPRVWASCEFSGRSQPSKNCFISSYSFDRIGLSLGFSASFLEPFFSIADLFSEI